MAAIGSTVGTSRDGVPSDRRSNDESLASYRFAGFEFDGWRDELHRNGAVIALRPKPLALLRCLLAHPGRLLGKAELLAVLWPDVCVTDDSLVQCVGELRAALGDGDQRLLRTLPRRGYRFEAPVEVVVPAAPAAAATDAAVPGRRAAAAWRRPALGAALALLLLLGAAIGWYALRPAPPAIEWHIDEMLAERRSVAILHAVDVAAPQGRSALGRELADAIAMHASLRSRPNRVVGAGKTAPYDGATLDLPRIARELGVRYVVTPRIERAEGRVRVTTQLVSVDGGVSRVLDQSEFASEQALAQSNLARRITAALRVGYTDFEAARFEQPGLRPDPVDLALAGWRDINRATTRDDLVRGRARLAQAARADAHSLVIEQGIGVAHLVELSTLLSPEPERSLQLADEHLLRALAISPHQQENLAARADVLILQGRPDEALELLRAILSANPNYATAQLQMARVLVRVGRAAEAGAYIERARNLARNDTRLLRMTYAAEFDEAMVREDEVQARAIAARWAAELPASADSHVLVAALDARAGRLAGAAEAMARHRALAPHHTLAYARLVRRADDARYAQARDRLLDGMRIAGLPER